MDKQSNKKQKILIFLFISVILVSSSLILLVNNPSLVNWPENWFNNEPDPNETPTFTNLTITVDFGNSTITKFQNLTMQAEFSTIFDLLDKNFIIGYDSYSNGKLITSINEISNNPGENNFWFYWVNDEYANVASSTLLLHSGDIVLWNYTDNQF